SLPRQHDRLDEDLVEFKRCRPVRPPAHPAACRCGGRAICMAEGALAPLSANSSTHSRLRRSMSDPLKELLDLLDLEPLEHNIYRGYNHEIGSGRVFGGQVLAQALVAARRTVDEPREAH